MSDHHGWECQGRQEHGWFGGGTCEDDAPGADSGGVGDAAAPPDPGQRLLAVLHGTVGHLHGADRPRYTTWLGRQDIKALTSIMRADSGQTAGSAPGPVGDALHRAVRGAAEARTQADLRDAGAHLANAFLTAQARGGASSLRTTLQAVIAARPAVVGSVTRKAPAPYPSAEQLAAIIYNETGSLYQIPGGPDLDSLRLTMAHVILNRFDIGDTGGTAPNRLAARESTAIFQHKVPNAITAYNSSYAAAVTTLGRWHAPENGVSSAIYFNNRPTASEDANRKLNGILPFLGTFGPYRNVTPTPHAPAGLSYFAFFGPQR